MFYSSAIVGKREDMKYLIIIVCNIE